jgi:cyclophilin family peptidyl-prolyl cis-trans isomerase
MASSSFAAIVKSRAEFVMAGWMGRFLVVAALLVSLNGGIVSAADLENTLYMDLPAGRVVIALRPDLAPHTVARIKELVRQHFYDGLVFHRVIAGFMAQTGDPTGTGMGGSGRKLKAEFSKAPFRRGTLGMARAQDPDSADSQFFICFAPAPFLDGKYTVFGEVVSGMEYVDKLKKGDADDNGKVTDPDKIIRMEVAADAPGK